MSDTQKHDRRGEAAVTGYLEAVRWREPSEVIRAAVWPGVTAALAAADAVERSDLAEAVALLREFAVACSVSSAPLSISILEATNDARQFLDRIGDGT